MVYNGAMRGVPCLPTVFKIISRAVVTCLWPNITILKQPSGSVSTDSSCPGLLDAAAADSMEERKPLFWRNPMNSAINSPVFARDEMGMDYLPVYADDGGGGDEPRGTVQNIGVRMVKVREMALPMQRPEGAIWREQGIN